MHYKHNAILIVQTSINSPQIEYTEIDGIKVRYEISGATTAEPLILMHGWGCKLETVRSIAASASLSHRVYNVDLPGFGQTPEPPQIWGVEEYTRFMEKFASTLGLENPALAGHSFGGRISLLFASRNRTSKLILIDSAGVKPRRPLSYYIKVYRFKLGKKIVKTLLPKAKADAIIERMRGRKGSADYAMASPRMRAILSKVVNEDLCNVMPRIKAPSLLIWGENDTATPVADAKRMEKLIPDAGLVVFNGVGHYSFLDNPAGFAAVIKSFLNSK